MGFEPILFSLKPLFFLPVNATYVWSKLFLVFSEVTNKFG